MQMLTKILGNQNQDQGCGAGAPEPIILGGDGVGAVFKI